MWGSDHYPHMPVKKTPKRPSAQAPAKVADKSPAVGKKRQKSIRVTAAGPELTTAARKSSVPQSVRIAQIVRLKDARERWTKRVNRAVEALVGAFTELRGERVEIAKEIHALLGHVTEEARRKRASA